MTASTMARAAQDQQLKDRVLALANKEILYNEDLANTEFGRRLRSGTYDVGPLMYPIAVDTEAAYETAINSGRGSPGYDQDVIPDAALTSAIVAHWPYAEGERPMETPEMAPPVIDNTLPDPQPVIDNELPEV